MQSDNEKIEYDMELLDTEPSHDILVNVAELMDNGH